ncbi:plasma membrane iron transport multicopper oxidase Fio1 [Schizosaccharomyces osmophilus]|uniref:Plasma membrane iron transport multicopper oxidase Fio1 n=1 Tax=Schizosaccharomyces osmophilus TaxID=2545709 RepID=A0AAE9WJQ3_9SCHI|nr:plasma membrane iron transport multicopper oxidase Fio1 [Schizosaccharomyces osmophilus]WBW75531.1 plasma membrane iron transport multicopper oxidase Fio1 [Schizosaccharomyces osmophilus]
MSLIFFVLVVSALLETALAKTRLFEWNVTDIDNLDVDKSGHPRWVMGVNNQWPIEPPVVDYGDQVIIKMSNHLRDNRTCSLHSHGMFQRHNGYMDGVPQMTQCSIPAGSTFYYNFTAVQNGTYWVHSHDMSQYPDGLRTSFVINNPNEPYDYDEDYIISLTDWYYEPFYKLVPEQFVTWHNPTGAEPVPDTGLINDGVNSTFKMEPGKTYRFRFVNLGAFNNYDIMLEDHNMTIIEVDGEYTNPQEVSSIHITTAQRYSVLVTAKNSTDRNYAMTAYMDESLFDQVPKNYNPNVTAWLSYNSETTYNYATPVDEIDSYDDAELQPLYDVYWGEADHNVSLWFDFFTLGDGASYAEINEKSFKYPKVPGLMIANSTNYDDYNTKPVTYGPYTNAFVFDYNQTVDVVIDNHDTGKHPFHLHGHVFQVLERGEENAGEYSDQTEHKVYDHPVRRDTIEIPPVSFVRLRFLADNPGAWLLHCHIEWHMESGLVATFLEAPDRVPEITAPEFVRHQCVMQNIDISGNGAGNAYNISNLTGAPAPPGEMPAGWTSKAIATMAMCVLSACIGMGSIIFYGMQVHPLPTEELDDEEDIKAAAEENAAKLMIPPSDM